MAQAATPADVAGLRLWLSSDALALTDGTPVSSWPDSSSSSSGWAFGQATGSKQPVFRSNRQNGLPGLSFTGGQHLTAPTAALDLLSNKPGATAFAVARDTAGSTSRQAQFAGGASDGGTPPRMQSSRLAIASCARATDDLRHSASSRQQDSQTTVTRAATSKVDTGVHVLTAVADWAGTGTLNRWTDGTATFHAKGNSSDTSSSDTSSAGIRLGAEGDGNQPWTGDSHEVLVYDRALTATDRTTIQNHLADRWTSRTAPSPVVAAVGDVACDPADRNYGGGAGVGAFCRMRDTAEAAASFAPSHVLSRGDQQYADGALEKFRTSYDASWGRFNPVVRPVPGNHEYQTPGAAGYYAYFGASAGDPTKGYYSYDVGTWHVVALNSHCIDVGGCEAGSAQAEWLRADLAASAARCTLAYWHEPSYSPMSAVGDGTALTTSWQLLYADAAEVVLNGHAHDHERFPPQDPAGRAAPVGIAEVVVGTGGKSLVPFTAAPRPNSVVRDATSHGVLELTLHDGSYDWAFVAAAGGTEADSGSRTCS